MLASGEIFDAETAKTLIGNSVLAFVLVLIVRWLLAHFDRREADRLVERTQFLAEMRSLGATLSIVSDSLREQSRDHKAIVEAQNATLRYLREIGKEIRECKRRNGGEHPHSV